MKGVKFKLFKKEHSKHAKEFVRDQELTLSFLNSPIRLNWLKFISLKSSDINKIMLVVNYYAKLKVSKENKVKPKTREQVIKIEADCLKKIFSGEVIKLSNLKKTDAIKVAFNIMKGRYRNSVVLDPLHLEKLAILSGLSKKDIPTDFLVFDYKNKKIIGVDVLV